MPTLSGAQELLFVRIIAQCTTPQFLPIAPGSGDVLCDDAVGGFIRRTHGVEVEKRYGGGGVVKTSFDG